jgi:hypothetical protein
MNGWIGLAEERDGLGKLPNAVWFGNLAKSARQNEEHLLSLPPETFAR